MQQRATVTRLLPDGRAELTVRRKSACSGDCHQCGGCGAVEQMFCLTAENPIGARAGDRVIVESAPTVVLTAAALVYLLPLAAFLVGYLATMPLGAWAFAVGAAGFALGLLPAFAYDRRVRRHPPRHTIVEFER